MSKKKLFYIVLCSCVVLCSCNQPNEDYVVNTIKLDEVDNLDSIGSVNRVFSDFHSQILEGKTKCLIREVSRLRVDNNKYYIFDDSNLPQVLVFNEDGTFCNKIGDYGKGAGEYQTVRDFALDTKLNRVILLLGWGKINVYDLNGQYQFSKQLNCTNAIYVESYPNGYVFTNNHHNYDYKADSVLYFYDKDFNLQSKKISVIENAPSLPGETWNLRYKDNLISFFDNVTNKYYFYDANNIQNVEQYDVKVANPCEIDKLKDYQDYMKYDYVSSQIFDGHNICGYMCVNREPCCFIYNFDSRKKYCLHNYGETPIIYDYHNGYYYSIIPSDRIVSLKDMNDQTNDPNIVFPDLIPYKDVLDSISPFSNFVILRMKLNPSFTEKCK